MTKPPIHFCGNNFHVLKGNSKFRNVYSPQNFYCTISHTFMLILSYPYSQIPIINIPGLGDMAAEVACDQMKVQSQNDRLQLDKAKELTYLKGFYEGVSE